MIRRMTDRDVFQVAAIEKKIFSLPWSEQGFADALASRDTIFLVAEEEVANSCGQVCKVIMGYIGMYISLDEGEITNVAVAEGYRRHGIGDALVEHILSEGKQAGVERFILEVRVSNEPAIRLYEKYGFVSVGVRAGFYEQPREDASIMIHERNRQ